MRCLKCNTQMDCVDDVVTTFLRVDWFECPVCKSKAEVHYDVKTMEMTNFNWKEGKQ